MSLSNPEGYSFKSKVASRKFIIMTSVLIASSAFLTLPALLSLFGVNIASIMTGGEYVSLIIGSFAIYSGANVAQKKIENVPEGLK